MDIIFSYISGLGLPLDEVVLMLNKEAKLFFSKKLYSDTIQRVMLIFVTENLNELEKSAHKIKYAKVNDRVAINIYLDNRPFLEEDLINRLLYIDSIVSESLVKNKRLSRLDIDIKALNLDLHFFFQSVISNVRQKATN